MRLELTMGVFQVYVDKNGEFCWRMLTLNGEVIAFKDGYKTKDSCLYGIESVRRMAQKATTDDQTYISR